MLINWTGRIDWSLIYLLFLKFLPTLILRQILSRRDINHEILSYFISPRVCLSILIQNNNKSNNLHFLFRLQAVTELVDFILFHNLSTCFPEASRIYIRFYLVCSTTIDCCPGSMCDHIVDPIANKDFISSRSSVHEYCCKFINFLKKLCHFFLIFSIKFCHKQNIFANIFCWVCTKSVYKKLLWMFSIYYHQKHFSDIF